MVPSILTSVFQGIISVSSCKEVLVVHFQIFYYLFFGRARICTSLYKFFGSHRLATSILLVHLVSIFCFHLQHGGPCLLTLLPNRIYIQARTVGDKLYRILVCKVTFLWVFYKRSYKPTMHR